MSDTQTGWAARGPLAGQGHASKVRVGPQEASTVCAKARGRSARPGLGWPERASHSLGKHDQREKGIAVGPAGGPAVGDWSKGLRTPRPAGVGGAHGALGSAVLRRGRGLRLDGVRVGDQQGWAQGDRAEPWRGDSTRALL